LRVLDPGLVAARDAIVLEARPHPGWPLARLMRAIDRGERDPATLRAILELPLPASWRRLFEQRLASGRVESWVRRLTGRD
nr:3-alpha domain-containing protein [Rubrivivax sp.]